MYNNNLLSSFIQAKNSGGDARILAQQVVMNDPQMRQMYEQMQNMSNGLSPQEFAFRYVKQNGINEQELLQTARMLGLNI